ncbi:MAG: hypothetical protein AAF074_14960 [Pseudomonadota bacterium]
MSKVFTIPALVAALAIGAAAEAGAWERKGTVTGARGTGTVDATGNCSGGACTRDVTRTGPYGRSTARSGSGSCAGGVCSGNRTTTGPAGQTRTRQGSISR